MNDETPASIDRIDIRPGVSVLSVLSHLNYQPWFALAEFVDNAIQSFLDRRGALEQANPSPRLRVAIEIDAPGQRITIRDNAAGIATTEFPRAFRPAEIPPDRTGLCEFGMGMKSAACWFAPRWSVRTSALGEPVEHYVEFDIERIVEDSLDELDVRSDDCEADSHFTEIVLRELHRIPVGRTVGKIRAHLQDIYRIFTRQGDLVLLLNGDELQHDPPEILVAPHYRDLGGNPIEWRHPFDFDFGQGLRAHGFAAIRKKASTTRAGFALFRRNRLIQGSGDEGYRPEFVVGKPNSFAYQRVFGEIHLDGFDVSHTKDGFQWDENEQPFLELLKDELSRDDFPLLQQAREHRVERGKRDLEKGANEATERTAETIREHVPPVLSDLRDQEPPPRPEAELKEADRVTHRVIDVELHGQPWRIVLELSNDPAVGDWLELSDSVVNALPERSGEHARSIGLRLSLSHPFMQRFGGVDCAEIEPLLRLAAALGLAEVAARDSGVSRAGAIRRNVNELLRVLSRT